MSHATDDSGKSGRLMTLLGIRRDEVVAVSWSFAYFFCILSAYYMLRPVRDAMAIDIGSCAGLSSSVQRWMTALRVSSSLPQRLAT